MFSPFPSIDYAPQKNGSEEEEEEGRESHETACMASRMQRGGRHRSILLWAAPHSIFKGTFSSLYCVITYHIKVPRHVPVFTTFM